MDRIKYSTKEQCVIDIECTKNDFTQEEKVYINLGYIGKAIKATHKKTNRLYSIKAISKDKIIKVGFTSTLNKYIEIMYKVDHCFFLRFTALHLL